MRPHVRALLPGCRRWSSGVADRPAPAPRCRFPTPDGSPRRRRPALRRASGWRAVLLTLVPALLVGACTDSGPAAAGEALRLRLSGPEPAERQAGVLLLVDGALAGVAWTVGGRTESWTEGGATWVAAVLEEPGPIEVVLPLDEGAPEPSVSVVDVVLPDNALHPDPGAFTLEPVR